MWEFLGIETINLISKGLSLRSLNSHKLLIHRNIRPPRKNQLQSKVTMQLRSRTYVQKDVKPRSSRRRNNRPSTKIEEISPVISPPIITKDENEILNELEIKYESSDAKSLTSDLEPEPLIASNSEDSETSETEVVTEEVNSIEESSPEPEPFPSKRFLAVRSTIREKYCSTYFGKWRRQQKLYKRWRKVLNLRIKSKALRRYKIKRTNYIIEDIFYCSPLNALRQYYLEIAEDLNYNRRVFPHYTSSRFEGSNSDNMEHYYNDSRLCPSLESSAIIRYLNTIKAPIYYSPMQYSTITQFVPKSCDVRDDSETILISNRINRWDKDDPKSDDSSPLFSPPRRTSESDSFECGIDVDGNFKIILNPEEFISTRNSPEEFQSMQINYCENKQDEELLEDGPSCQYEAMYENSGQDDDESKDIDDDREMDTENSSFVYDDDDLDVLQIMVDPNDTLPMPEPFLDIVRESWSNLSRRIATR